MATTPKYAPPVAYYELTPEQRAKLKAEAQELHALIDKPTTPWRARTNAQARLQEVEGLLRADDLERRRREQLGNEDRRPRLARSDDGQSYLLTNAKLDDLAQ